MTEEELVDINSIIKKLSDYFEPKSNTTYEHYVFNSCDQEIGERFDSYLNKLRKLIKTYRYSTLEDELLHDRIVMGTNKKEIRTRLLSELDLTLDRTIDICWSTEQRDKQVDMIGSRKTTETVHYAKKAEKRKQRREHIKDCKFCRLSHDKGKCQAYGLTCAICLKRNHVARMCQSQVHPPWSNNKTASTCKGPLRKRQTCQQWWKHLCLGPFVRPQTLLCRHSRIPLRWPESSNPQVPNWHSGKLQHSCSCGLQTPHHSTLTALPYKAEAVQQFHSPTPGSCNTVVRSKRHQEKSPFSSSGQ